MKLINRKRKLIFEFADVNNGGILIKTKIKGNVRLDDIKGAKQIIDERLSNGKNRRK